MSVTINGTTGIAGVDGSASTPAYQGADTNTGIAFPAADTVSVATGGSERMRIASAGGVHIGTTSTYGTNSKLSVFGSATAADTGIVLSDGATTTIGLALATPSTGSVPYIFGNNNLAFGSNGAERMRIDSSGNVGIGTSSPAVKLDVSGSTGTTQATIRAINTGTTSGDYAIYQLKQGTSSTWQMYVGGNGNKFVIGQSGIGDSLSIDSSSNVAIGNTNAQNTASGRGNLTLNGSSAGAIVNWSSGGANKSYSFQDGTNWSFYNNVNGGNIDITAWSAGVRLSSGGTSWSSLSDERKKDIIEPIENAIEKVVTLRAVIGKYKTDEEGTRRSFLIAQDVQAVLPEAVDAQDSEQLGLRYTETIPLLVAAIQELKALSDTQAQTIEALTARIEALEASNV